MPASLALVATPVLAVFICLTLVGLAVGLTAVFFLVLGVYAAQVFAGAAIGQRVLGQPLRRATVGEGPAVSRAQLVKGLALGLLLIRIGGMVPYVGQLVWLVVLTWGLGAVVLTLYGRARPAPVPT